MRRLTRRLVGVAVLVAASACSKGSETSSTQTDPRGSTAQTDTTVPAAPPMSYAPLVVTDDDVAGIFAVGSDDETHWIRYQSRSGVMNVLENVVDDVELTGYVKVEKAYRFGEKIVLIVSTGEGGQSCPATTYVFTFDTKGETVLGKKNIDGCSESVESLAEKNALTVKKEGQETVVYNGDVR